MNPNYYKQKKTFEAEGFGPSMKTTYVRVYAYCHLWGVVSINDKPHFV